MTLKHSSFYLRHLYMLFLCILFSSSVNANEHLLGNWVGEATTEQEKTGFVLHVSQINNNYKVSVSLTDIGVSKWPAIDVKMSNQSITMNLPSDSGKQKIELQLSGNKLSGQWHDSPSRPPSSLSLLKADSVNSMIEHTINIAGHVGKIGVSYFLPENTSLAENELALTAVVLTHGSGKVSRDINRYIAESFARRGIVSIFYDKRGVGETEGDYEQITFRQLADDAVTVAKFFQNQPAISSVGFWGHSQGGWIAPLATLLWKPSKFAIMSAGPAVSPAREAEWTYLYPIHKRHDFNEIQSIVSTIIKSWHDGLRTDDFTAFRHLIDRYENEEWFEQTGIDNLRTYFLGQFYDSYKLFMDYQPEDTLSKLNKPIMAIFAIDDESINSVESIQILNSYKRNGKNIELVEYHGYSHSMRKLASKDKALRFPNFPDDYFTRQVQFIKQNCH